MLKLDSQTIHRRWDFLKLVGVSVVGMVLAAVIGSTPSFADDYKLSFAFSSVQNAEMQTTDGGFPATPGPRPHRNLILEFNTPVLVTGLEGGVPYSQSFDRIEIRTAEDVIQSYISYSDNAWSCVLNSIATRANDPFYNSISLTMLLAQGPLISSEITGKRIGVINLARSAKAKCKMISVQ